MAGNFATNKNDRNSGSKSPIDFKKNQVARTSFWYHVLAS